MLSYSIDEIIYLVFQKMVGKHCPQDSEINEILKENINTVLEPNKDALEKIEIAKRTGKKIYIGDILHD